MTTMIVEREPRSHATAKRSRSITPQASCFPNQPSHSSDMDESPENAEGSASPFLRLPKELRVYIYCKLLQCDHPVQWPDDHVSSHLTPALLLTCRLMNREATPILYTRNTLGFQHPSDCNMFAWAHSVRTARTITSIALNVRDRDVRSIWTSYLSSTHNFRSLQFDFPRLRDVHITFKSTFWVQMGGTPDQKYQHWVNDERMRDVAHALKDIRDAKNVTIRITAVHRVPAQDVRRLKDLQPTGMDLEQGPNEFRTGLYNYYGTWFSLVLMPTTPL